MLIWFFIPTIIAAYSINPIPYNSNLTDEQLFTSNFNVKHLSNLKQETKNLFNFAWDNYMNFGFPNDELSPISCQPIKRDPNYKNIGRNDLIGNISLTLFDSMDSFIIMNEREKFHDCVEIIIDTYNDFAIDSIIQVFEMNIRVLGGLISGHLFAIDQRKGFQMENYNGELLKLAYDLGKRLVLSYQIEDDDLIFNLPRVNLKYGKNSVPNQIQTDQCISGMTSLILEFSMLSRLTNDPIFEDLSRRNIKNIWNLRSTLDLIPMSFNTKLKKFTNSITGTGASIDSFYEYLFKYSILFNDDDFNDMWIDSYKSLLIHSKDDIGIFHNIDVTNGIISTEWIDSLGAFFPGLQNLAGDLKNGIKLHLIYLNIWNTYGCLPERWNFNGYKSIKLFDTPYKNGDIIPGLNSNLTNEKLLENSIGLEWYPLRPEFIESSYHLYQSTNDPIFLKIGEDMLKKLRNEFLSPCGFTGIKNILTNEKDDRMESFVLSETFKYLYLLFDQSDHSKKFQEGNTVFSTEGHPFWWDNKIKEYEKVTKYDIDKMNEVIEIEYNENNLKQWLWRKVPFNLNKSFKDLKEKFYKLHQDEYFIDRMNSDIKRELRIDDQFYSYGKPMMVDSETHVHIKEINKLKFKQLKAELQSKYNISIIDDDFHRVYKCDKYDRSEFITSNIMRDSDLYSLAREYPITLRRPEHMIGVSNLELEDTFYSLFVPNESQSLSKLGKTIWRGIIAQEANYNIAPIYRTTRGDVYIDEMEGLKVVFDNVVVDGVEYLNLVQLNGMGIERGEIVYVNKASNFLFESMAFSIDKSHLVINGMNVLNILVIG